MMQAKRREWILCRQYIYKKMPMLLLAVHMVVEISMCQIGMYACCWIHAGIEGAVDSDKEIWILTVVAAFAHAWCAR